MIVSGADMIIVDIAIVDADMSGVEADIVVVDVDVESAGKRMKNDVAWVRRTRGDAEVTVTVSRRTRGDGDANHRLVQGDDIRRRRRRR